MRTTINERRYCLRLSCPLLVFCLLFSICFLIHPGSSSAEETNESTVLQCRDKPARKARQKRMAGDLFARAEKAFSAKQYIKAIKRFLCSLYTVEHEATITNIEEILKEVENKTAALKLLEDYIALNPEGALTPKIAEIVASLRIELGIEDPNASDKKEVCEEKPPAPLKPVCISVVESAPFIEKSQANNRRSKLFSLATLGAGAAFVIAGGVFQGLSLAAKSSADGATSYDDFLNDIEKKKQFQAGAVAGFVGGALTAGIGLAQFLLVTKQKQELERLTAAPPTVERCETPVPADEGRDTVDEAASEAATPQEDAVPAEKGNEDAAPNEGAPNTEVETDAETGISVGFGAILFTVRF